MEVTGIYRVDGPDGLGLETLYFGCPYCLSSVSKTFGDYGKGRILDALYKVNLWNMFIKHSCPSCCEAFLWALPMVTYRRWIEELND